jgi:hypothetical protein
MGWVVNATPQPLYPREEDPVPIVQEAGRVPGPVWTGAGIHPVASRYTDWAMVTHSNKYEGSKEVLGIIIRDQ